MDVSKRNPLTNILPSDLSEEQFREAVAKSGYPLQGLIAQSLRKRGVRVQEEWAYFDRDTGQLRSIDILAELDLCPIDAHTRVRPTLDLIVECKRADYPYVFFLSPESEPPTGDFPLFAGLFHDSVTLRTDDDPSTYDFRLCSLLNLDRHSFMVSAPSCTTFSKCVRNGKTFELSGTDPFHSLVLPLLKAIRHFQTAETPAATFRYFDLHLILAVGLIDGPMVGVPFTDKPSPVLLPWVRVFRHEYQDTDKWYERNKLYAVDVVHKDYFGEYIDHQVMPFAKDFGRLALKHHEVLATGKGFANSLGRDWFPRDLETRLRVRAPIRKRLGRIATVVRKSPSPKK